MASTLKWIPEQSEPKASCTQIRNPSLHVEVTARGWLTQAGHLEELVLEGHIILGLQTNAGTEDIRQGSALLGKSIDDRSARGCERCLC
jgi:hypothetical protein